MTEERLNGLYFNLKSGLYLIKGKTLNPKRYGLEELTSEVNGSLIKLNINFVDFLVNRYISDRLYIGLDETIHHQCNNDLSNYYDRDHFGNYYVVGNKVNIQELGIGLSIEKNESLIETTEGFLDHIAQIEINISLKKPRSLLKKITQKYRS